MSIQNKIDKYMKMNESRQVPYNNKRFINGILIDVKRRYNELSSLDDRMIAKFIKELYSKGWEEGYDEGEDVSYDSGLIDGRKQGREEGLELANQKTAKGVITTKLKRRS